MRVAQWSFAAGLAAACAGSAAPAHAQTQKLAVLQAEDRRAATLQDLTTIRVATRSLDPDVARTAVRALGRLERPALVADIIPLLRHSLPEVRAEAANAAAQATQGIRTGAPPGSAVTGAQTALAARLDVEAEPIVRAAICEALGRLPYASDVDAARAEGTLLGFVPHATTSTDRLGIAKALEALTRLERSVHQIGAPAVDLLRSLAGRQSGRSDEDLLRDARVRRLALEGLINATAIDAETATAAAADPDPQVRRLAVRATTVTTGANQVIARALTDPSLVVRIEALRAARGRLGHVSCEAALNGTADPEPNVALVAIDQLSACGDDQQSIAYLVSAIADRDDAEVPRNWHRAAHALVALATAAPDRARPALSTFATSHVWQLRLYAARAAAMVKDASVLETLAADPQPSVAEAALNGLSAATGHSRDAAYISALSSTQLAVVRAGALALGRTPAAEPAVSALKGALQRLDADPRPGALEVRTALRTALADLGVKVGVPKPSPQPAAPLAEAELRRLAAPRARFTIRDVGVFDVALFTAEAPATVLRFADLVASGYYNGLTFHRVAPNGFVRGGSPDASDYGSTTPVMRDEVGQWPHVRGAIGMFSRGRDAADGEIFIDLVDNPRYDHTYTVFAQVLNGLDVIDRILEGDEIDSIAILP
jgi:cyclophilin family peptidyl-prolyl cis-trans isomerase/HEAT repeat protein